LKSLAFPSLLRQTLGSGRVSVWYQTGWWRRGHFRLQLQPLPHEREMGIWS